MNKIVKTRIVKLLVQGVTVYQDHIDLEIRTLGLQSLAAELAEKEPVEQEDAPDPQTITTTIPIEFKVCGGGTAGDRKV